VAISEDLRIGSLEGASAVQRRRTTQELVFEFLRDAILSGRLRGGSRLVQDRIAVELNVSRVPVREALLQLESRRSSSSAPCSPRRPPAEPSRS
jgi:DNA-binding transcriptional MocR family regulator